MTSMSHRRPAPNMQALDRLLVQNFASRPVRHLGADQRCDQIQLGTTPENIADASKHAVDFSVAAKTVEVERRAVRRLLQQFLVRHDDAYPQLKMTGQTSTYDKRATLNFRTQIESNFRTVPYYGTSWTGRSGLGSVRQRNDESLDHIWQLGQRHGEARNDDTNGILSAEQHNPNDAFDDSDFVNAVEENLSDIMRVKNFHYPSPFKANSIPFVASSPNGEPASANCPQPRAEAGNNSVSLVGFLSSETAATTINLTGKQIVAADKFMVTA